jgi:hypothetical protein
LAGFYSLLILDASIEEGYNPEGVDPRPEMARAHALISTQPLVFRDRYVEVLDEMQNRWERKAQDPQH